jgi:hypothetical protein
MCASDLIKEFHMSTDEHIANRSAEIRLQVHAIVEKEFAGDRDAAARILENETRRRVSNRTVQAWLMPAGQPSSRKCPEWALAALQAYMAKADSEDELAKIRRARAGDAKSSRSRTAHAVSRGAVELATGQIHHEASLHDAWTKANLSELPEMLYRFQLSVLRRLDQLEEKFDLLGKGLASATTLEEYQYSIAEGLADIATAKFVIGETLRDIETGKAEFAHPEGLPT